MQNIFHRKPKPRETSIWLCPACCWWVMYNEKSEYDAMNRKRDHLLTHGENNGEKEVILEE